MAFWVPLGDATRAGGEMELSQPQPSDWLTATEARDSESTFIFLGWRESASVDISLCQLDTIDDAT